MTEITIHDWAARNCVSLRTAQQWAKKRRIPARKRRVALTIQKMTECWMIPADAGLPVKQ